MEEMLNNRVSKVICRFNIMSECMRRASGIDVIGTLKDRRRCVVTARNMILYKLSEEGYSPHETGIASEKDRTTVYHSIRTIGNMLQSRLACFKNELDVYEKFINILERKDNMEELERRDIDFNGVSEMIHEANVQKGFCDGMVEVGTSLMLVVSELAEALEADRNDRYADKEGFIRDMEAPVSEHEAATPSERFQHYFERYIKDTFEDEIADAVIRLFHIAGVHHIDLNFHISNKLKYNSMREPKHGKKY